MVPHFAQLPPTWIDGGRYAHWQALTPGFHHACSVRARCSPLLVVFPWPVGPSADIARDVAAQIAARRGWREILVTRFRLLPRLKRGRLLRPPVPALRALLRGCRRGEQCNEQAADMQ